MRIHFNIGILLTMRVSPALEELLNNPATRVCVLTGAGVSQESGVPTFRDKDGLWQKFRPEELARMDAFMANPQLVWDWYEHRRQVVRDVQPNAGHLALVAMEKYFADFTLITQNVDGLHARAGSRAPLEVHGNILRSYCIGCGKFAEPDVPAICEDCGSRLRPDVVWFGEMLPEAVWQAACAATASCDLFFTIGTSAAVYPAASLPLAARERGAYLVEVNPADTDVSSQVDEVLRGPSAIVLPELVKIFV